MSSCFFRSSGTDRWVIAAGALASVSVPPRLTARFAILPPASSPPSAFPVQAVKIHGKKTYAEEGANQPMQTTWGAEENELRKSSFQPQCTKYMLHRVTRRDAPRLVCQIFVDLECPHGAARQCQDREDRGIIAGAGADMGDGLARLGLYLAEPHGMQHRLAIVDAFVGIERHQHVLVDMAGIGARRLDPAVTGDDGPRPWAEKVLSRHAGEDSFKTRVRRGGVGGHQPRVERPGVFNLAHREEDSADYRFVAPAQPTPNIVS